jgi:hypothetical protein
MKAARLLIPMFSALLTDTPALAQLVTTDPPGLADTAAPGSVLVWPKFVQRIVTVDPGAPGAAVEDKTTIELGAVCPGADVGNPAGVLCQTDEPVRVRLNWVCPAATVGASGGICQATGFDVVFSVNGKATFNPSQNTGTGDNTVVPMSPCPTGYLIGWAVDDSDRPIKFNGLIGDAIQRNTPTDLQSESALAIQADPRLANAALVTTAPAPGGLGYTLLLDGQPGDYQMVSGQFEGDIRYSSDAAPPFSDESIILLTLNLNSNLTNPATDVALDFYNENETLTGTAVNFICWAQYQLTAIDPSLTVGSQGTRKGVVVSGQAVQFNQQTSQYDNVTLLAVIQTTEGALSGVANQIRSYVVRPASNSVPIPAQFVAF